MEKIAVVGAGTMGNGIVHAFAQHGYPVCMIDISEEALKKARGIISSNLDRQIKKGNLNNEQKEEILNNIHLQQSIREGVQDAALVVEAVSESPEIKASVFQQLDEYAPSGAILATNTSSISITKIASVTQRPSQVIGMHFMNPVPVMKLVEVVKGFNTSNLTTEKVVAFSRSLEKVPVTVEDYPGFVSNRILMPMINEAIISLFEGVANVEAIDTIMQLGMAHPMGPLKLADFIGLDVCLSIMNVLHQGLGNPKYAPCPLLVNMVTAGNLGAKSGMGFYDWTEGSKNLKVASQFS
jgi:3-hydroxybutyryl-CoA dehydrogenase